MVSGQCADCKEWGTVTNNTVVKEGNRVVLALCPVCVLTRSEKQKRVRKVLKNFAFQKYRVPRKEREAKPRDKELKERRTMSTRLAQRIAARLRAGALVVIVQDADEQLALAEIRAAAEIFNPVKVLPVSNDEVNEALMGHPQSQGVLVIMDYLSVYGENPVSLRLVRDVALQRRAGEQKYSRLILLEKPEVQVPTYLSGDVEIVRPALPTVDELQEELNAFIEGQNIDVEGNGEERYALAAATAGLSRHEANRLYSRCFVENKELDRKWLRREKAKVVTDRLGGALTFENTEGVEIGGLENLRSWLASRKAAFSSAKAKAWGLPEPKGLLLLGIPGGGKSAMSKSIAQEWELPLMRLDMGRLFGSLVGQSEAQARAAIEAAEASAPCVLWLDEIEKGMGGTGSKGDSGTTARVFGTFLTWLQEKTSPVFVVATANDISALPPELLRKGRFDEIFYVGLPTAVERRAIFRIHIERTGRSLLPEKINALAEASVGYTGAEIEQAVIEGLFTAFGQNKNLEYEDILKALKQTTPLSVTMSEKITALEKWAKGRARHASKENKNEGFADGFSRPGIV